MVWLMRLKYSSFSRRDNDVMHLTKSSRPWGIYGLNGWGSYGKVSITALLAWSVKSPFLAHNSYSVASLMKPDSHMKAILSHESGRVWLHEGSGSNLSLRW